ncbi:MAG: type II toxin-antitoxin system mRNA interferase toxin, RelE/StbE family [bacterium]
MKIVYHKKFEKQYSKLPEALKDKTRLTIATFVQDPHDKILRNHALKGRMQGLRAISVTGSVRIVLKEENSYTLVIFLSLGGHDRVYE